MTEGLTSDDLITLAEALSEAAFGYGLMVGWFLAGVFVLALKMLYSRCRNRHGRALGVAAIMVLFGTANLAAVRWLPG